jgi:hypothetical protein
MSSLFHPNVAGSAGEMVGSRYKLPGPDRTEWGPVPGYVAYDSALLGSIVCRLQKLTLSLRTQVTLHFRLSVMIFSRSALNEGAETNFLPGSEPALGGGRVSMLRPYSHLNSRILIL